MSFDLKGLQSAVKAHGRVVRVVIADLAGSSPRGVGTAMLVWADGQSGTIGGGALEFEMAQAARQMLAGDKRRRLSTHALGPDLGQCCGGRVSILSERHDVRTVSELSPDLIVRPAAGDKVDMPLSAKRVLAQARAQGDRPVAALIDGWMIEPVLQPSRHIWIWGAGHVGRALVDVLAPLPDLDLTWIDTVSDRFPTRIPSQITVVSQKAPGDLAPHAPCTAEHYILTYSHALDLELCHQVLSRGFAYAGLIGSATKWARFRKRLSELGHSPDQIARITCPIGDPALGKHPAQIAIGVAHELLMRDRYQSETKDRRA
ncbi:xanthine dehydrogenase accessory protein XdhC [Aestuariivita sp.]|jgi:xanthine dehydrogenase accessory factor|uniref:xanthine dehydrogenase accessory protein XdhC n=1 Tax=Aestuariivita sp. TaxID=1872407 RepID=UPI00216E93AB|nr:xanthine dehydrogenase accessory protein XdhC [Aestuariivita sp.]MCE8008513.1 xanthine dehydrogenase accessory protein XdhC [Aestuariivita sp.]